jgi:prophage tail gpP-like protein
MNDKSDSTGDLNKVSIEVDGVRYEGWKSARIEIGIEQICRGFVVAVTDNFPGNKNFSRLQPGQKVTLRIGETTVCTGYITSTPI